MSSRFTGLQPWLQPYATYLYNVAVYNHLQPRVTSVFRSRQKQLVLYQRWKSGKSDLPAAPPGKSKHEYGLAFDMVVKGDYRGAYQQAIGHLWQQMGGHWFPSDPVHFEV